LEELQTRQANLLKPVAWYTDPNDKRIAMWKQRAAALDPDIARYQAALDTLQPLCDLFAEAAALPQVDLDHLTINDVISMEISQKRQRWGELSQEQLLHEIITKWFQDDPDRFPEWLVYMVIHFSGMRYSSAHSSWADPRYLLELFSREDLQQKVDSYDSDALAEACSRAVQDLQSAPVLDSGLQPKTVDGLVARLQDKGQQKQALLEFRTSQALEAIQSLPDDNACLARLEQYKAEKDASPDPMPPWVWAEIVKYTPLRLDTQDPDWEATSPERWNTTRNQWAAILSTWEHKDITAWRTKHHESLDLVVTRAVCNEIAEHIQHLRGLIPAAGLASKPFWFIRQARSDPRAFFKQAPSEADFRPGASILWLEWLDTQPNAWQVARPLNGYNLIPGTLSISEIQKGQKGEVRKKDLEHDWEEEDDWKYRLENNAYIRSRPLPSPQELKKMGKTPKEIQSILAERKNTGNFEQQYLRWRHEATVIEVVDLVDGRYVMTFETGKIGVILRRLSSLHGSPMVFVGYVPAALPLPDDLDQKLVKMLRWDRILPKAGLPERIRPGSLPDDAPSQTDHDAQPVEPVRTVLVLHDNTRLWRIYTRDRQGRPRFQSANPPLILDRGERLEVSLSAKESIHDAGAGLIHARDGVYLKVNTCTGEPRAAGLFVRQDETADYREGRWVQVNPAIHHTNPQVLKGRDLKGKPYFEPTAFTSRIKIAPGQHFRISTSHTESFRDAGDGIIFSSGLQEYTLVLECPAVPDADGLYVEKEEIISVET
jgi:hypothetical protein